MGRTNIHLCQVKGGSYNINQQIKVLKKDSANVATKSENDLVTKGGNKHINPIARGCNLDTMHLKGKKE